MTINQYISEEYDLTSSSASAITTLGAKICSSSQSGDFSCLGWDKMLEIQMLYTTINDYGSCFKDLPAMQDVLKTVVETCAMVPNPIAPPVVEPSPCDDHSLLTEAGLCIITEDDEIPVIHE